MLVILKKLCDRMKGQQMASPEASRGKKREREEEEEREEGEWEEEEESKPIKVDTIEIEHDGMSTRANTMSYQDISLTQIGDGYEHIS